MTEQQTATERVNAYVDVYTARMARPNSSYDGQVHSFGLSDGEVKLTVQDIQTLLKLAKLSDAQIRAAEKRGADEYKEQLVKSIREDLNWRSAEGIADMIENGEL